MWPSRESQHKAKTTGNKSRYKFNCTYHCPNLKSFFFLIMTQSAEEFILISTETYKQLLTSNSLAQKEESTKQKNLEKRNVDNSEAIAQLSAASALNSPTKVTESVPDSQTYNNNSKHPSNLSDNQIQCVTDELLKAGLSGGKIERSKTILTFLSKSNIITVNQSTGKLHCELDGSASTSDLLEFLANLQLLTKKISQDDLNILN